MLAQSAPTETVFIVMAPVHPRAVAVLRRCRSQPGWLLVVNPHKTASARANAVLTAKKMIERIEAGQMALPDGGVDIVAGVFAEHRAAS